MLKRWLLHVLTGLLTASLCSLIVTTVLNQTLLNSHYLEQRITAINGYKRLSNDISSEVTQQSGLSSIPGAAAALSGIISPGVMQQKVNSALSGLQSYYQGKSSAPTLNLSDLAGQAQAAGVPLGQDSDLFQPVTLGPQSSKGQHPALDFRSVHTAALVTTVLLTVLVGLLSWKWRQYGALPNVLISVGVLMGLLALLLYLGLGRLSHYITLSGGSEAFAALGRDLVQNIADDLAHRFGIIAAVSLVIGIISRIATSRFQAKASGNAVLADARASTAAR